MTYFFRSEIPNVIRFISTITKTFSGQLTLQEAQTRSVRHCLSSLPKSDCQKLMKMLESVCRVWNHVRGRVNRFECEAVDIPELTLDVCTLRSLHKTSARIRVQRIFGTMFSCNNFFGLQKIFCWLTKIKFANFWVSKNKNKIIQIKQKKF